ncbi:MAG: lasso peptide biosynthesis B2 protein [Bacteroidales bacterium]|nr:lasso peptide biosynthesis B2 protein [Bacteroidales bacterium]MCI1784912.1 lasso peptide biosynthesis B2 protein [Bacteroidales bacterium]
MFTEAWFLMAFSRILTFFIPFRLLLPILGKPISDEEASETAAGPDDEASKDFLVAVQRSILRAARRSPWRTKCFEQALTARMMLKRKKLKSVIYFGVNKNLFNEQKKDRAAHAWIICSGFTVTGGRNNKMFTVVGRFSV